MGIAAVLAVAVFVAIRVLGMRQFGAEDGGIAADLAYMVKLGYRPYTDIQTTGIPPLFFLFGGWALKLLGVSWESLVTLTATFSAVALVSQTWLLTKARFHHVAALLVATLTQCATLLPLSSWWYNQATSVLGALFVSATLALIVRPKDRGVQAAFVACAVLLSWSKPNVAALLLLGAGVSLLLSKRTRFTGLAALASAALLSLIGLGLAGVNPLLVVRSYLGVSSRVSGANFVQFFWVSDQDEAIRTLALLVPLLIAGFASAIGWATSGRERVTRTLPFATMAAFSVITGFIAMGTNNDHNLVEAPLIVLGCVALAHVSGSMKQLKSPTLVRLVIVAALGYSIVMLSAAGMQFAYDRGRVKSIGPGVFYEEGPLAAVGGPPFLANVQSGPALKQVTGDITKVLELNPGLGGVDASVYFGPRLLVMYPEFGVAPPKGLPTWWGLYPEGAPATNSLIQTFVDTKPALVVFYEDDYTYYPESLLKVLFTQYEVYRWSSLTLHVRKGAQVELPEGATRLN